MIWVLAGLGAVAALAWVVVAIATWAGRQADQILADLPEPGRVDVRFDVDTTDYVEMLTRARSAAATMQVRPTVAMVDAMLTQLRLDREVSPYWSEPPHSHSLEHAEAWLLSLRDHLENQPAAEPAEAP